MKLEVGMYVRTKEGLIAKYIGVNNKYQEHQFDGRIQWFYEYYRNDIDFDDWEEFIKEEVIKVSHNIIDLIEENDYIRIVTSAFYEPVYYSYGKLVIRDDIDISKYTNKFIAEVITHEQMESMSYKVG